MPGPSAASLLYDPAGKPLAITDPEAAKQAYMAGQALPVKGQQVGMVHPDTGEVVQVDANNVEQALAAGGSFATDTQFRKAELQAKWGKAGTAMGLANYLGNVGASAVRGATLGTSDAALVEGAKIFGAAKGERMRQRLAELKELYPITSGLSEVGGAIAGVVASGGENTPGVAARLLPTAAADLAGGAAQRVVTRGVAGLLGESTGARILARGAGGVARGVTEGAATGLGRSISEAELGNHELTAEQIMANVKHDALTLGVVGGGLGVGHGLLESAVGLVAPKLRSAAEHMGWKALAPTKATSKLVNSRVAGGTNSIGRRLLDEGILPKEGVISSLQDVQEIGAKIEDKLAEKLRGMVEIRGGSTATVKVAPLLKQLEEAPLITLGGKEYNLKALDKLSGYEGIAQSVRDRIADLGAKTGVYATDMAGNTIVRHELEVPVQQLLEQRIGWDQLINYDRLGIDKSREAMKGLTRALEDNIVTSIGTGPGAMPGLADELKALKTAYHELKYAQKAVANSADAYASNRFLSLGDTLPAMGAIAGGHPFAAPVVGVGGRYLRRNGPAAAASIFDRLADIGTLKKLAADTDAEITRGVGEYFKPSNRGNPVKLRAYRTTPEEKRPLGERYDAETARVRALAADPEKLTATIAANTGSMGRAAPNTQGALSRAALRGVYFLASKLPPSVGQQNMLQPTLNKSSLSDTQKAQFLLYADAVKNPKQVIADLRSGAITPEQVEALQAVYPQLYTQIREKVMQHIAEETAAGRELPYQKRIQLGTLFGAPTDETLQPDFVAAMQQLRQPAAAPANPVGRPPNVDLGKAMGSTMSDFDKRERGMSAVK